MPFSKETTAAAWRRANGKCECERQGCGHDGDRCNEPLREKQWHAHHITAESVGGTDTLWA